MSKSKELNEKPVTPLQPHLKRDRSEYLLIFTVLLGALFLFSWGIGSYSLWDPWEPKYALTVQEMESRGDFMTPYFNDEPRWTKPILIYWAMYVPMMIFGNNEFAARLPSVIAAVLGLLMTYCFLKKLRGNSTAIMSVCILATIPQYFYMARQAMPDMLMTLFLISAMGFFALGRFGKQQRKLYFALFYVSAALAFLTKGPVTSVIILAAIIMFWMININPKKNISLKTVFNNFKTMLKSYYVVQGIIIFFAIAAPWIIVMVIKHGEEFVNYFVFYENLDRFEKPVRGHEGSVTYYVSTLFYGMYPWFCMLPVSVFFFFSGHKKAGEEVKQRWYYLSWFLSIFLIFTLAGTKQQHYMLPITPLVAVMAALVWEEYFNKDAPFWISTAFLLSIAFFLLPISAFLTEGNKYIFDNFTNKRTIDNVDVDMFLKFVLTGWAIVMILSCLKRRSIFVAVLAVLIAYSNGIYFSHYVIPKHEKNRTMKHYVERYLKEKKPDSELVFFGKIRHTIDYYYGKDKYHYFNKGAERELAKFVKGKKSVYIIAQQKYVSSLKARLQNGTKSRWQYISTEHPRYYLISYQSR